MSHFSYKTSFEAPPRDRRKVDQVPVRVPPHKKPRRYRLEVRFETVTKRVLSKEFTNKADMQAFRLRVERQLEKEKTKKPSYMSWYWDSTAHDLKMDSVEKKQFKSEPEFTETMFEPKTFESLVAKHCKEGA